MKKDRNTHIKLITILVILTMILSYIFPVIVNADPVSEPKPDSVRVVTDEEEKLKLLGITSSDARTKNKFGLADEFSVFTKENITFTDADSEGRIAAGGTITATTSYPYHAGTEVNNDDLAKIIAGNGIKNMELSKTQHYTPRGTNNVDYISLTYNKKIAAIGTNANNMQWSSFNEANLAQMVSTDLIDFNSEFQWIQNKSNTLANTTANGQISRGKIHIKVKYGQPALVYQIVDAVIFKGNDTKQNVFNLTVDEFNQLCDAQYRSWSAGSSMIFDVPANSEIIINIIGEGTVRFNSIVGSVNSNTWAKGDIYVRAEDEDIASNPSARYTSVYEDEDFLRDQNGNIKVFKLEFDKEDKRTFYSDLSKKLIYNIPQATSVQIADNMIGKIVAPKADVSNVRTYGNSDGKGFLYGNLIAKSYIGPTQFRTDKTYKIEMQKIFAGPNPTDNAELRILDNAGKEVVRWSASGKSKDILLGAGKYTMEEVATPGNYVSPEQSQIEFEIIEKAESPYYEIVNYSTTNQLVKKSKSLGSGNQENIRTTGNLEGATGINSRLIRELEFEINTDITEDLYYIVASNGYGLRYDNASGINGINANWAFLEGTDWIEMKKWTNVKDGIRASVPTQTYLYDNNVSGDEINMSNPGTQIHFYTLDGTDATEVTDQVEITDIKAIWYEVETQTTTYDWPSDFDKVNYYIVNYFNRPINVSLDITKTDKETGELLKGASYTFEDEQGQTRGGFSTNEDGKAYCNNMTYLVPGTYYLVERAAPKGYKKNLVNDTFVVQPNINQTIQINLTDEKIKTNIQKQDEYGNALQGATIQLRDSQTNQLWYQFESTNTPEVLSVLSGFLVDKEYTIHELFAPEGFEKADDIVIKYTQNQKVLINDEEVTDIIMKDKILKGSISITKTGEVLTGKEIITKLNKYSVFKFLYENGTINDATYELYAKDDIVINGTTIYTKDQLVDTKTTQGGGIATFDGIPMGDYYIKEKTPPAGYEIDTEKHDVSLIVTYDENNNQSLTAVDSVSDERVHETIKINKTQKDTDIPVKDAIYGLYNKELFSGIEPDTLLDIVSTDENGQATFEIDLPVGNYYVKEVEAPMGYVLSTEKKDISFTDNDDFVLNFEDDILTGTIEITKKGELLKDVEEITKLNNYNVKNFVYENSAIEGVTIELYAKEDIIINGKTYFSVNEKVGEQTTNENGLVSFDKLPAGKYYAKEKEAPKGFKANEEEKEISLVVSDENKIEKAEVEVTNERVKETIKIVKTNKDSGNPIRGCVYGVYNKEKIGELAANTLLDVVSTDDNGEGIFDIDLPMGSYYLKEIEVPDGYVVSTDIESIEFDGEKDFIVELKNEYTKINVKKIDTNGKYVKGAKLVIKDKAGNIVAEWTSDDKAFVINAILVAGETYTIEEIETPEGYAACEKMEFTVPTDGKAIEIKIINGEVKQEEPAEEPAEEPIEEPAEEPTEEPIEKPVEEPTEKPIEKPTEETKQEEKEEVKQVQTGDVIYYVVGILAIAIIVFKFSKVPHKKGKRFK